MQCFLFPRRILHLGYCEHERFNMKKIILFSFLFIAGTALKSYCQTVYAAEKGTKYHTADCRLSGDAVGMKLKDAEKAKKTACAVCKPQEHFKDKTKQCSGKTKEGAQCKRMTADKSGKCYQHKPKE